MTLEVFSTDSAAGSQLAWLPKGQGTTQVHMCFFLPHSQETEKWVHYQRPYCPSKSDTATETPHLALPGCPGILWFSLNLASVPATKLASILCQCQAWDLIAKHTPVASIIKSGEGQRGKKSLYPNDFTKDPKISKHTHHLWKATVLLTHAHSLDAGP